jgi:hypothetical protein
VYQFAPTSFLGKLKTLILLKEKEKRKAWQKLLDEKVAPADAEKKYIELVDELKKKYGERTELTDAEKKEVEEAKKKGTA